MFALWRDPIPGARPAVGNSAGLSVPRGENRTTNINRSLHILFGKGSSGAGLRIAHAHHAKTAHPGNGLVVWRELNPEVNLPWSELALGQVLKWEDPKWESTWVWTPGWGEKSFALRWLWDSPEASLPQNWMSNLVKSP